MFVTFGICLKQYFDTRYLVFYNTSPPRMFLSLDLLWEYRIQHGANGPLDVTSSYSTWIFCRGVSGLATDCPCRVWCRGLTTCLLHIGPPFGNRILNNSWAVGLTKWTMNLIFFVFWHMQLYMSWYIRSFFGFTFLNILYFSSTLVLTSFYRRSLYTFYCIILTEICIAICYYGDLIPFPFNAGARQTCRCEASTNSIGIMMVWSFQMGLFRRKINWCHFLWSLHIKLLQA